MTQAYLFVVPSEAAERAAQSRDLFSDRCGLKNRSLHSASLRSAPVGRRGKAGGSHGRLQNP